MELNFLNAISLFNSFAALILIVFLNRHHKVGWFREKNV